MKHFNRILQKQDFPTRQRKLLFDSKENENPK